MTAWFDGVSFAVEVAFLSDPLAESPTWTDITNYVRSIDTDTGRTSEYSEYSPGSLSLVLSNNDRRFDPEYTSGAYVGTPLLDEDDAVILTEDGEWIGTDTTVYLLPMKRIRVQATYSATTYPIFDGFILGWPQFIIGMTDETVRVSAVDGFRFLENSTLQRSAYEAAVLADSPAGYWPMQEQNAISTPYDDLVSGTTMRAISLRGTTPVVLTSTTSPVVGATASVAATPDSTVTSLTSMFGLESTGVTTDPLSVEAWVYVGPTDSTIQIGDEGSSTSRTVSIERSGGQWVVGASSVSLNCSASPATAVPAISGAWSHVVATIDGSNVKFYLNGQLVYTQATSAGTYVNSGVNPIITADATTSDAVAHFATYSTTLTLAQVQAHYLAGVTAWGYPNGERSGARIERVLDEIGWPDALRDISTGDTVHGEYTPNRRSALAYLRQVAAGEDGPLFMAPDGKLTFRDRSWQWAQATSGTFSDDGSDLKYSDIVIDANTVDAIKNQVAVSFRSGNGYVRVEDAASVTAYGPSSDAVDADTVDAASIARGLANYRLRTRSDPRLLISELEVKPRAAPSTMYPVVMDVKIGDVVTVERTPAGVGSQIVKKLTIQGYSHEIGIDNWVTKYYLAPAPTSGADAPYLLVNTSGATSLIGAASGNLIPF